jgi:hypothetical protein
MPSVQPITVSDLNGIEFNPGEIVIDDVVGYVGYVRSLCTDLGTPNDSEEGYKDFLEFQNEINSSHISTFEPDVIDTNHSFDDMDLTGINEPIREYHAMQYLAVTNNQLCYSYLKPVTPFDLPEKGNLRGDRFVTPFDIPGLYEEIQRMNNDNEPDLM